jgi:hypothetical protein
MLCILVTITTGNGKKGIGQSAKRIAMKSLHLIHLFLLIFSLLGILGFFSLISRIFSKILTCLSSRFKKSYLKEGGFQHVSFISQRYFCVLFVDI